MHKIVVANFISISPETDSSETDPSISNYEIYQFPDTDTYTDTVIEQNIKYNINLFVKRVNIIKYKYKEAKIFHSFVIKNCEYSLSLADNYATRTTVSIDTENTEILNELYSIYKDLI